VRRQRINTNPIGWNHNSPSDGLCHNRRWESTTVFSRLRNQSYNCCRSF